MTEDILHREFAEIINSLQNVIFSASYPDFRVTYVNSAIENLTGYPTDYFMNDSTAWMSVYHPEDLGKIEKMASDLQEFGFGVKTYRIIKKDGSVVWVKGQTQVIKGDDGDKVIGVITDISDQVSLREEIKKTSDLLDSTDRLARIGAWEFDVENDKLYWSQVTKEIHEVPDDFEPSVKLGVSFYKEGISRERVAQLFSHALETGEPFDEEFILITAKGNEIYVRSIGKAIVKNRRVVSVIGIIQDIDRVKKNQIQLLHLAEENERIFEGTHSAMFLVQVLGNNEFRYIKTNRSHQIQTGIPLEMIQGKTPQELVGEVLGNTIATNYQYALDSGRTISYQENLSLPAGNVWWWTQLTPSFQAGKVPVIIGASIDITELKNKEEELNKSLAIVNEQNSKLLNFTYIVSHNLRSHSSNIYLLTQMFKEEKNPEEKDKYLELLTQATQNLMETIANLNDIVSIHSNFQLQKAYLNLKLESEKVLGTLGATIDKTGAQFQLEPSLGVSVLVNPAYLESILLNLFSNALKYAHPDRQPVIRVFTYSDSQHIYLFIEDNGIGIDLEKYGKKVFGMYKTFHKHPDSRGLGLFIVKNQMEAMGGQITVESEPGEGSTFKLTFPKAP